MSARATWIAAVCVALFASACAVRSASYYLPADSSLVHEGTTCGWAHYGFGVLELGDGVRASFQAAPRGSLIVVSVQVTVAPGATVRFPEPTIELVGASRTAELRLGDWATYMGAGPVGHVAADAPLEGRKRNGAEPRDPPSPQRDLFISNARAFAPADSTPTMVFPAAEVNGARVESRRIKLRLVERTDVLACVQ